MGMDRIIEKKKWTTSLILKITGISVFSLFIIYLLFIRDKQSRLFIDRAQVTIATVMEDKFQEFIPVDGVVVPKTTFFIDAVQGGFVEKVYVEDGAILKEGDTIMKLSNANLELSLMEQETRIFEAINNLENTKIGLEQNKFLRQKEIVGIQYQIDQAQRDFARKQSLYRDEVISEKEFEDSEREHIFSLKQLEISLELKKLDSVSAVVRTIQIESTISRMQENLDLLRTNLESLFVRAPASGKLSSFSNEIGQTKLAGEQLGQIDMMDGFKLRASIDERYISRVFIGQEASFDYAGQTYNLSIAKIYTDVTGGSFQVDLFFEGEEPDQIKRGQTLQLRLAFSSPTDAVIVRRGGFFQTTGGNWIYVVDPSDAFATKRMIRIGRQNIRYYEVLEGVEPGEKVIISSYDAFGSKDKLVFR
jgi:HlyD family secretion protein